MGRSEPCGGYFPKARLGDKTTNTDKKQNTRKTVTHPVTQKAFLQPEHPYILT